MKKGIRQKLLLLVAFLTFTTISSTVSYCLNDDGLTYSARAHNLPEICPMCGMPTKHLTPDYSGWDEFGYVIYQCSCGYWFVYYEKE